MSFLFDFVSFSNHTLPNVALAFGWIPSLVNQFITLRGILFYNTWCSDYFCVLNTVSTNHLFCIQQKNSQKPHYGSIIPGGFFMHPKYHGHKQTICGYFLLWLFSYPHSAASLESVTRWMLDGKITTYRVRGKCSKSVWKCLFMKYF